MDEDGSGEIDKDEFARRKTFPDMQIEVFFICYVDGCTSSSAVWLGAAQAAVSAASSATSQLAELKHATPEHPKDSSAAVLKQDGKQGGAA